MSGIGFDGKHINEKTREFGSAYRKRGGDEVKITRENEEAKNKNDNENENIQKRGENLKLTVTTIK